ncbi:hypothetical protein GCM10009665_68820 [Kitasatospora nipponensis]|uniref:Uncharacterized protein n=1 Tax=Kitasatospora nipponensis TaxID=258049 RepID=A0ABP4HJW2_9ACTN
MTDRQDPLVPPRCPGADCAAVTGWLDEPARPAEINGWACPACGRYGLLVPAEHAHGFVGGRALLVLGRRGGPTRPTPGRTTRTEHAA